MDKKTIVLTLYGTENEINDFSITLFEENDYYDSTVKDYCANINELALKDNKWIHAIIIKENQKIKFVKPCIYTDFDIIATLDDRSIQRVIREVDNQELKKALKSAEEKTFKAILKNMSKRAAKMLVEDMVYMGPVRAEDVNEARKKIVRIMQHLEDIGEITVSRFSPGERI